jgi:hypothetical protein
MFVDPQDGLHVAYQGSVDATAGHELRYAHRPVGQDWQLSVADDAEFTGRYVSLNASQSALFATFVRADGVNGDLYLATKAIGPTTAWVKTRLSSSGTIRETALAIDSAGDPHVVFDDRESGSGEIRYHRGVFSTIDSDGSTGAPDVAIDLADGLHVVYPITLGVGDYALKYAYRSNSDEWTTEFVDRDHGQSRVAASIAVDSSGGVHIAYTPGDNLYYAFKPANGVWMIEAVDTIGSSLDNSVALDSEGGVHIAYRDVTGTALAYAYRCR